jgi:CTP-dependent riboflavin kinase
MKRQQALELDPAKTLKLSGRVVSGRKRGARNTRRDTKKLQEALGTTIVDGTLNIILKRPVMFSNETAIQIPVDDGGPPRLEWPAKLNGTPVWINRRIHPLHIASLLSAVHLRTHARLADGDEVHIEVRQCDVGRVALVGRLTWMLFWSGRKRWFYTRGDYLERAQSWCNRFGATQLATEENCRGLSLALIKTLIRRSLPGPMKRQQAPGSPPCETVSLRGRVASGRGRASSYVAKHTAKIREALGEHIVAGSLNIILKRPVMLREETAIKTCFDGLLRLHWPGRLNGVDVWLQRWDSAPLHIMEPFCAVHLRTHLNLRDGDEVAIEARKRDVIPISNVQRVAWMLLWSGRRQWHYTNARYYEPAERWGKAFGATQLGTKKRFRDLVTALVKMAIKKIPGVRSLRQTGAEHD